MRIINNKYFQVKEMFIYFIGTLIVSALNFILSILYSHLFIPNEYGDYAMILSMYSLIATLTGGWLTSSIVRLAGKFQSENKYDAFRGSIIWTHILISGIWILVTGFIILFGFMPALYRKILFLLTLNYFFEYLNNSINFFFRFNGEVRKYNRSTILRGVLKIIIILFVCYGLQVHAIIVLPIALLISETAIGAYWIKNTKILYCLRANPLSFSIIKEVFLFGLPLVTVSAASWVLHAADKYIISFFYSSKEVGIYSYAHQIGSAISNLIAQSIMLGAYPKIVKAWERCGKREAIVITEKYLKIFLYFSIPMAVGVTMTANLFFKELIGEQYQEGVNVFIFTCYGILMMGLSQYPNKAWELTERTVGILRLNIETAVLNLILNFIFVPLAGYRWAAITTFLSFFYYYIMALHRSKIFFQIHFNVKSLMKTIVSSCIMGLYILLLNKLMEDSIIKLFVIVLGGFLVYIIGLFILREFNLHDFLKNEKGLEG